MIAAVWLWGKPSAPLLLQRQPWKTGPSSSKQLLLVCLQRWSWCDRKMCFTLISPLSNQPEQAHSTCRETQTNKKKEEREHEKSVVQEKNNFRCFSEKKGEGVVNGKRTNRHNSLQASHTMPSAPKRNHMIWDEIHPLWQSVTHSEQDERRWDGNVLLRVFSSCSLRELHPPFFFWTEWFWNQGRRWAHSTNKGRND